MDTVPQALLDGPGAPALACTAASLAAGSVAARRAFRAAGRRVLAEPQSLKQHLTRVRAACAMAGSEPVQGSLADLWCATGEGTPQARHDRDRAGHDDRATAAAALAARRQALAQAQGRLMPHVARAFALALGATGLACTEAARALATRWSVIARPTLARPERRLRCGPDDSRALAAAAAEAVRNGDAAAGFIEHCRVCGDVAAFLLARRPLLAQARELPPAWLALADEFERRQASRQEGPQEAGADA